MVDKKRSGIKPSSKHGKPTNNIARYTKVVRPNLLPYLQNIVDGTDKKFFNTHHIDETLLVTYPKWKEITRSLRIVIIYNILTGDDFKFKKWSGKIKKVLYRPD